MVIINAVLTCLRLLFWVVVAFVAVVLLLALYAVAVPVAIVVTGIIRVVLFVRVRGHTTNPASLKPFSDEVKEMPEQPVTEEPAAVAPDKIEPPEKVTTIIMTPPKVTLGDLVKAKSLSRYPN